MDSNSEDDKIVISRGRKPIVKRIVDSNTESDSNDDSVHSPLNSPTEINLKKRESNRMRNSKKKERPKRKHVFDSNSNSEDDAISSSSDEEYSNSNASSDKSASNSRRSSHGDSTNVSKRRSHFRQSTSSINMSNLSAEVGNSSLNQNKTPENEVIVPETDDEDEGESQCYSPQTRLSLTGRRPRDLITSDESSSDHENVSASDTEQSVAPIENKKRSRNLLSSFTLNESIIRTPIAKRPSSRLNTSAIPSTSAKRAESIGIIDSDESDKDASRSIFIDSAESINDSQILKTIVHSPEKSIILVDSSDDGDHGDHLNDKMSNLTIDFDGLAQTSTPSRAHLVQPKITGLLKVNEIEKKYVSQQYYDQNLEKLEKLKADWAMNLDLFDRLQSTLPDKGVNLKKRLESLKSDVRKQEALFATLIVEEHKVILPKVELKAKLSNWNDIESGANVIQPKYTGKQGLSTFNDQKALTLDRLKRFHDAMETCPSDDTLAPAPNGLKVELMRHQRHGLAWMLWRESQRPKGGILADDMGLGKTLSVIALVLGADQLDENNDDDDEDDISDDDDNPAGAAKAKWTAKGRKDYYYGGTLIICPASLINQWECEVETRVNRKMLNVKMHHGTSRESSARKLSTNHIVITTYGVVVSEQKSSGPLFQVKWDRIVLDEAHIIRNHGTNMAQSCCQLKSSKRWGLTGTPIQNKEMDLYSLLKFLKVTPFDELPVFKKWINTNTVDGRNRLNNLLKPLILRRTKVQLQEQGELQSLPAKEMNLVMVKLTKEEMNVYSKILTLSRTLFAQFLHQRTERDHMNDMGLPTKKPNDVFHKMHAKFSQLHAKEVKSAQILVLLTRLRQICDHPGLIDKMLEDELESDSDDEEGLPELDLLDQLNKLDINESGDNNDNNNQKEEMSKASSKVLLKSNPVFNLGNSSSKCTKTLEIVQNLLNTSDDKIVIVSQWTSVLNILAKYLKLKSIHFVELTGKTAIKLRNEIVVNFNKPSTRERIMLLSLVAGGVGLNLTGANHLLLMDPHWNPQLEAQAFDRVYRVGQKKPVQIYKLLCENTIEERIKGLQDHKLGLSEHVLTGSSKSSGSKLSFQDLRQLFDM